MQTLMTRLLLYTCHIEIQGHSSKMHPVWFKRSTM